MTDAKRKLPLASDTRTTWTPGPWTQDATHSWLIWAPDRERRPICEVFPDNNHDAYTVEELGNIRLIAAAPSLYEALERMANIVEGCEPKDRDMCWETIQYLAGAVLPDALAALRLARGE